MERLVVDAIHLDMLRTHGGMRGLRDEAGLDSALARPGQRFVTVMLNLAAGALTDEELADWLRSGIVANPRGVSG